MVWDVKEGSWDNGEGTSKGLLSNDWSETLGPVDSLGGLSLKLAEVVLTTTGEEVVGVRCGKGLGGSDEVGDFGTGKTKVVCVEELRNWRDLVRRCVLEGRCGLERRQDCVGGFRGVSLEVGK